MKIVVLVLMLVMFAVGCSVQFDSRQLSAVKKLSYSILNSSQKQQLWKLTYADAIAQPVVPLVVDDSLMIVFVSNNDIAISVIGAALIDVRNLNSYGELFSVSHDKSTRVYQYDVTQDHVGKQYEVSCAPPRLVESEDFAFDLYEIDCRSNDGAWTFTDKFGKNAQNQLLMMELNFSHKEPPIILINEDL